MEEQRFDDLARLIGSKTSRRQMLKVLAGTALGGILGTRLSPVWAAGAGANGCARYCNQVFGEDTAATTQCIQDAKRGTGLCYSACGPGGSGGTLCGGPDYSSTTCCSGSTPTCTSGTCTGTCQIPCLSGLCTCPGNATITTAGGTTTCVKTCTTGADCDSGNCVGDVDGVNSYCAPASGPPVICVSDADCPQFSFCPNLTVDYGTEHICITTAC